MNVMLAPRSETLALTVLVDRAASALAGARNAAEVLDARDQASFAYDAAKKTARLMKAKRAHDDLIAAAYRAQAAALEIEAGAKRRLADEYDAAQERGDVATHGGARNFNVPDGNVETTAADIGLSRKAIHEARVLRDAEIAQPGVVRKTLDEALVKGEGPTKAAVRRAVLKVLNFAAVVSGAAPTEAKMAEPSQSTTRVPARGRAAICERVREAIITLSGLPPAYEVAGYFASADASGIISDHIGPAAAWLADFNDAWKDNQC